MKATLEQGLTRADNLTGALPQVSGMVIRADFSRQPGSRLVRLDVAGTPVNDAKTYRLATIDFLANGGDGYKALQNTNILIGANDGKLLASHVMAWLMKQGSISPTLEGRTFVARTAAPK